MTNKTREKLREEFEKNTRFNFVNDGGPYWPDWDAVWEFIEKAITQSENRILRKWKKAIKKATAIGGFEGYEIIEENYFKAKKEIEG